jgi:hypothetical protein
MGSEYLAAVLYLLEQLGIGQRAQHVLSRLKRLLQQGDDFRFLHGQVRVPCLALGSLCGVDKALGGACEMHRAP